MSPPVVQVSAQAATALRQGFPWVYRQDVAAAPRSLDGGAVVSVVDAQRNPVGQAFWASASPIALRLLTRRPASEQPVDDALFAARLEAAWQRRAALFDRDAFRVVHGEADLLPGLFVDRYGDALVVQTLSQGADVRKARFAELLAQVTGASRIVCRDDGSGRDFEGLPREKRHLAGSGDHAQYHEGRNLLTIDLLADAKTGSFLDQLDNHLLAGRLGRGEALDTFSYHGGFALSLARSCAQVTAVEQDEQAAQRARANAEANGLRNVVVQHANAFDVLRACDDEGRRFDTVVLDPPGLAKRKQGLPAARRAYHELNVRALKLLRPEGLLVTCSCSGKVSRALFDELVLGAARDAKKTVQILERRGAGLDHPVLPGLPETEYLKAWFIRVVG